MREAIRRFLGDDRSPISERMFCELAGISRVTFRSVFHDNTTLTPMVQVRVEKALEAIRNGDVRVMQNRDKTRYLEYRRESKPEFRRGMGLELKNGKIGLKVGLRNPNDYLQPTFKEQLDK